MKVVQLPSLVHGTDLEVRQRVRARTEVDGAATTAQQKDVVEHAVDLGRGLVQHRHHVHTTFGDATERMDQLV